MDWLLSYSFDGLADNCTRVDKLRMTSISKANKQQFSCSVSQNFSGYSNVSMSVQSWCKNNRLTSQMFNESASCTGTFSYADAAPSSADCVVSAYQPNVYNPTTPMCSSGVAVPTIGFLKPESAISIT